MRLTAAANRFIVPVDLVSFLHDREEWAGARGLSIDLTIDGWSGFADLFRALSRSGSRPDGQCAFPGFADPNTGFWMRVDRGGQAIATYASYLIPMLEANLCEQVERHGWYPGARDRWFFAHDAMELAEHIVGAVMFNGGIAVHERHRKGGDGLSDELIPVLSEIGRVLGYGLHASDGSVYMAKPRVGPTMGATGSDRQVMGVDWFRGSEKLGPRRLLGWTSTDGALRAAGRRT
jgi:hypothetical protein